MIDKGISDEVLFLLREEVGTLLRLLRRPDGKIVLEFFFHGHGWKHSRFISEREYEMEFKEAAESWQKEKDDE